VSAQPITALGTDFYVPAWEVKVGGRAIDRQAVRDVLSVSYTDSLESVDTFSLEISNWDEERRTTKYSEGDLFEPGQQVELRLGYLDAGLLPMLTGEITSLQPRFPADGPPTLTVSGLSLLHRLRSEERSAVYENKTDSQIAREIAGRLGVRIETPASGSESVYPYVIQNNQQDVVFLLQRARKIGYELTVQEDPAGGAPYLLFAPQERGAQPPYRLEWGRSLLAFEPRLTTANQVGSVTVRSWHPTSKQTIEATVNRSELGRREPFASAFEERREVLADRPVASEAEARQLAMETLRRIAQHYVTASATTIGLPRLRTGALVELGGLGARYLDGIYFITGTTHAIGDSGYTTQFQARKEDQA
jgi:phage protein D